MGFESVSLSVQSQISPGFMVRYNEGVRHSLPCFSIMPRVHEQACVVRIKFWFTRNEC